MGMSEPIFFYPKSRGNYVARNQDHNFLGPKDQSSWCSWSLSWTSLLGGGFGNKNNALNGKPVEPNHVYETLSRVMNRIIYSRWFLNKWWLKHYFIYIVLYIYIYISVSIYIFCISEQNWQKSLLTSSSQSSRGERLKNTCSKLCVRRKELVWKQTDK